MRAGSREPLIGKQHFSLIIYNLCQKKYSPDFFRRVTDTSVTMAVKAHLRNQRPVVLAVSTNDALGAAAKNIGQLMNCRNIYFVPMRQDDPQNKPASLVADFSRIPQTVAAAMEGRQLQPVLL